MRVFAVSERIEDTVIEQKKLFPDLDFYSASTRRFPGISTFLVTPIVVCSRFTGWGAHILERRSDNRLIRASAEDVGPAPSECWVPTVYKGRRNEE